MSSAPFRVPQMSSSQISSHVSIKVQRTGLRCSSSTVKSCIAADGRNESSIVQLENQDSQGLSMSLSHSRSVVKAPTAPWMKSPLLVEPDHMFDLSKRRPRQDAGQRENSDDAFTGKISGGRGKKAMKKIFQGIEKLQETQSSEEIHQEPEKVRFKFLPGELWGDKEPEIVENARLQRGDERAETREIPEKKELNFSLGEAQDGSDSKFGGKMPWERRENMILPRPKRERVVTTAELTLDGGLLARLRSEARRMKKWVKVKKAGVTQSVIDQIRFAWKEEELVMVKFDLPLCRNMDRAREIIEIKTGGLVVWSKKDVLVVYRGCKHNSGLKSSSKVHQDSGNDQASSFAHLCHYSNNVHHDGSMQWDMMSRTDPQEDLLVDLSLYERETDRLLDSLGPRYVDWWYPKPLPVDADLLPELVPGFRPPPRLCPPRARSKLSNHELTYLRMLARPLPTHFVLGRNRKLQGLAAAILKLWETCHITKIALKWGIPNTDNEQMANELKHLTGGVLLLRNKFFIIIYRGKDFLSPQIARMVDERQIELDRCQLQEDAARSDAVEMLFASGGQSVNPSLIGTLSEFKSLSEMVTLENRKSEVDVELQAVKQVLEKELRNQERKLMILRSKIKKSAEKLAKLNSSWQPGEPDSDKEVITKEERECLRMIGLKMDRSLVLGRRGVFDGVIEGLHQHWKHREVVKVVTMQKSFSQVIRTANLLEVESGGVLVSVEKLKEGQAILLYRGKNYRRPTGLGQNLLNRREALCRSLEMQRIGALKFFASEREQVVGDLKNKLEELSMKKKNGLTGLYKLIQHKPAELLTHQFPSVPRKNRMPGFEADIASQVGF